MDIVSLFAPSTAAPGDYTSRAAELARQQKLADMLSQMSQQEIPVSTAGGISAPVSPYSALAKALTGFGGSYLAGKAAADEAALKKSGNEQLVKAISEFGQPYKTVDTAASAADLGGEPIQQYTMKTPTSQEQMGQAAGIMSSGLPGAEAIGSSLFSAAAKKQETEQERERVKALESTLPRPPGISQNTWDSYLLSPGMRTKVSEAANIKAGEYAVKPQDLPTSVDEYNFAQTPSGGNFKGSYTDWLKTKAGATHISIGSQTAKLSPEDLDFMARQALSGDTSVFAGLGYGQTGAANRVALRSAMTKIAKDQGISGPDIAAINAQYFGTRAGERALGTRSANIDMAVSEANQLVPLALDASAKVNRTNYPSLNTVLIAAAKGTGDPNVVKLGVATNSLINTYARAINPSGVPTVSDKEHARELLENAWSKGQYSAAVSQLKLEMDAAAQSPDIVRERLRNAIPGVTNNTQITPQAVKPPEYVRNPKTGKLELKAQ